jgi:hypothetical protein
MVPEAAVEDSGNAVEQLAAALGALEGAVLFKTLAVRPPPPVEFLRSLFKSRWISRTLLKSLLALQEPLSPCLKTLQHCKDRN